MSLFDKYLQIIKVDVGCRVQANALLTCNMNNVTIENCDNVSLACKNLGRQDLYVCSKKEAAAVAAKAARELADEDEKHHEELVASLKARGYSTENIQDSVKQFVEERCSAEVLGNQNVTFPHIYLRNCDNITIRGINQLDQQARCSLGAVQELMPSQLKPIPGSAPSPSPSSSGLSTEAIVGIVVGIIIFIVFIIVLAVVASKKKK